MIIEISPGLFSYQYIMFDVFVMFSSYFFIKTCKYLKVNRLPAQTLCLILFFTLYLRVFEIIRLHPTQIMIILDIFCSKFFSFLMKKKKIYTFLKNSNFLLIFLIPMIILVNEKLVWMSTLYNINRLQNHTRTYRDTQSHWTRKMLFYLSKYLYLSTDQGTQSHWTRSMLFIVSIYLLLYLFTI